MVKDRLYPTKKSGRYYILTLLRIVNQKILEEYVRKGDTILDYGCGNMPYKRLFEDRCKNYIGVDFSENDQADLHLTDGRIPLESNSVDVVISTQVLEHVEFPEQYLKECYRVLKQDGKLLLSTHGHWKYHPDPTDFWRWTKDGLEKIITVQSFKIITIYGLMGLSSSGLQLFQDGFAKTIHLRFKPFLYYIIAWFQEKLDKKELFQKDASVYYVVAKK
ncbi:MAG: SAM-dependent methyltransferase [Psychroserpens sp.]|jgi:SAM-dependent methyltransferase